MKNTTKEILFLSSAIACLCAFSAMLIMVKTGHNFKIDQLNTFFYTHQNGFFTGFFKIFTYLGEWWAMALIGGLVLIYAKDKRVGIFCLIAVAVAVVLNLSVKYIVRRPRPTNMIVFEEGYSFPSAHAMISFTFYSTLIYFVNTKMHDLPMQISFSVLLGLTILLLGLSRVYLNVHYFSDVLAGFLFGFVALYITLTLFKIIKAKPAKQLVNQT